MAGKRRYPTGEEAAKTRRHGTHGDGAAKGRHHPSESSAHGGQLAALHCNKLWDWRPSAVVALAACPQAAMMAVGLESGDLQLWDLNFMVCLQTVVGFGLEVTALAWAKDSLDGSWRTIAAALDGSLAEVSWKQSRLVGSTDSGAGAVWALAAQPAVAVRPGFAHQIAAGCDDGSVRMFGVESGEPGVTYERSVVHLQGRVLALSWHPNGKTLVAGGADGCIHICDAATGHEQRRISVGASTSQPVCVWRLLVLPDGTIVSGDQGGAVQFWDSRYGTLLQRFVSHAADVMALAASSSGSLVWAAGVDSKVVMFEHRPAPAGAAHPMQWAAMHHKRPHAHDVRALATVHGEEDWLVSGALDAQLMLYPASPSFLQKHPSRLTKAPQPPMCRLAPNAALQKMHRGPRGSGPAPARPTARVLCAHHDALDIWQTGITAMPVGEADEAKPVEGQAADLAMQPRHLARIQMGGAARVSAADIAPGGVFIATAVGPAGTLRVYKLSPGPAQPGHGPGQHTQTVERVPLRTPVTGATALCLSDHHIVTAHSNGMLTVLQLPAPAEPKGDDGDAPAVEAGSQPQQQAVVMAQCRAWEQEDVPLPGPSATQGHTNKQTWRDFTPAVSHVCLAPDGVTVAAAGSRGLSFLRLQGAAGGSGQQAVAGGSLQRVGQLVQLPYDAPVTSMAFSSDSALLALTLASGDLVVIDVALRRRSAWSAHNADGVRSCLARLPGNPAGVSFAPGTSHVMVHSPNGFCYFDMGRPAEVDTEPKQKRRRTAARPDFMPQAVGGAGPVVDYASAGSKQALGAAQPQHGGYNGRVVRMDDPVAFMAHLGPQELLLMGKPWADVVATMPPPLYRQRFGS